MYLCVYLYGDIITEDRAVIMLRHSKQLISVTIAHATEGVFCAVRTNSDANQQQSNCRKLCFLWVRAEAM
jgi:hypothetical protein